MVEPTSADLRRSTPVACRRPPLVFVQTTRDSRSVVGGRSWDEAMRDVRRSRLTRRCLAVAVVALTSAAVAVGPSQGSPSSAGATSPVRASGPVAVQQPVFVDGMAMPVYTESPASYVEQELWVTSSTDSDGDGNKDLIHIDVTRPEETEHGLQVPVVFEASPYFAGGNAVKNHNVDHTLYAPRHLHQPWPSDEVWGMAQRATTHHGPGVISNDLISTWSPAASPSSTPSPRARVARRAARRVAVATRRSGSRPSSTGSTVGPRRSTPTAPTRWPRGRPARSA